VSNCFITFRMVRGY